MLDGLRNLLRTVFSRKAPASGDVGKAETKPDFIKDEDTGFYVETDDPMVARAIAECLKSGKPVVGNRDEDGNVKIRKLER